MDHFMTVSSTLAWVQSVDDKAVFLYIGDTNAHHSEWLESLSPADRHGVMHLIFAICQVVSSWFAVILTLLVKDLVL